MHARLLMPTLLLAAAPLYAQKPLQSVTGIVREVGPSGARLGDAAQRLAGAEVLIGNRTATTNERGVFRLDSVPVGQYPLTVRLVGYRPLRGRVPVVATEPTRLELYLMPAPFALPALIVDATRTGIHGTVADTAFQALPGAKVAVLGVRGGEAYTDSLGGFDFPNVWGHPYIVRVTKPGYAERHVLVELGHKKGKELAFRLPPETRQFFAPGEGAAMFDLGRRLVFELNRSRMTSGEMERYGSIPLCDVPRVRAHAGDPARVWLNGVTLLPEVSLCAWRADEVEMVEFGSEFRAGYGPSTSGGLRPLSSSTRRSRRAPRGGQGYVIIWEKR